MAEGKLGSVLKNWQAPKAPSFKELSGRYVRLVRLSTADHAAHLFRAYDGHDHIWDYLPYGPFNSSAQYFRFISELSSQSDPYFLAIQNKQSGQYLGVQSYLRIDPNAGSIESHKICP